MIVAEQKPLEEIRRMIAPYEKILILGCGTCMTVCNAGGEREVSFLHNALRLAQAKCGDISHTFSEYTLKRQCDSEFMDLLAGRLEDVDAVLSLGCGIGVQAVAESFPDIPVLPGVNTSFMGMAKEWGIWDERCAACGECRLGETGGICPITRCTKGILNGQLLWRKLPYYLFSEESGSLVSYSDLVSRILLYWGVAFSLNH